MLRLTAAFAIAVTPLAQDFQFEVAGVNATPPEGAASDPSGLNVFQSARDQMNKIPTEN